MAVSTVIDCYGLNKGNNTDTSSNLAGESVFSAFIPSSLSAECADEKLPEAPQPGSDRSNLSICLASLSCAVRRRVIVKCPLIV